MMIRKGVFDHVHTQYAQTCEKSRRVSDAGDRVDAPAGECAQRIAMRTVDKRDGMIGHQSHRHFPSLCAIAVADSKIDAF